MHITDYCSEYLRDIYNICSCFDGQYQNQYLYCIDNKEYIPKIHEHLKPFTPHNELSFDSGFVTDFHCKDRDGFIVIQSVYNDGSCNFLPDVLNNLSDYIKELNDCGAREIEIIDSYSEIDSTLYSFDIAFFIARSNIDYPTTMGKNRCEKCGALICDEEYHNHDGEIFQHYCDSCTREAQYT